jgi:hypothetical protein
MILAKPQQPILDDGKHWEADKLERKKVADYLTPLVESITQPFVISLASDYGTGKTFFIKCWRKDLEAKGLACVYFNAWETDFSQDPLFAFIAAIKRELSPLMGADSKFNDAVKKAGGITLKKALPLGLKALLRFAVGNDVAKEALDITKISEEDLAKAADGFAEERLRSQQSAEGSISEFRTYLAAAVAEMVEKKPSEHQKIVVFVDDLDRCRPDYAISVLECIKHLFSVPGLVFVLSIDDKQLHQAAKAVYGPGIDSDGYLKKFIDWRFNLPKVKRREFIEFLFEKLELGKLAVLQGTGNFNDAAALKRVFSILSDSLNLSLRQVEQLVTDINLYLRILKSNEIVFDQVLSVVVSLKAKHPVELERFVYGQRNACEVIELLPNSIGQNPLIQFYGSLSRFHIIVAAWFLNSTQVEALGLGANAQRVSTPGDGSAMSSHSPEYRDAIARIGEEGVKEMHRYWTHIAQSHDIYNISLGQLVYQRLEQIERFK